MFGFQPEHIKTYKQIQKTENVTLWEKCISTRDVPGTWQLSSTQHNEPYFLVLGNYPNPKPCIEGVSKQACLAAGQAFDQVQSLTGGTQH